MQIYVHRNNQQLGPFTEAEIKAQLAAGTLSAQDHVWWQGQKEWMPLSQTPLGATGVPTPPAAPPVPGSTVLPGTFPATATTTTVQPTSNLAIWALVCGCMSLLCGIFTSIPAIILGHMALSQIKKNPAMSGRGLALAGTILGYVFTVFIVLYLSIFGFALIAGIVSGMKDQQKSESFTPSPSTNSDDSTTNSSGAATNSAPTTTNTPDQSTSSMPAPAAPAAMTNSPDASTNSSAPSTNAPAVSTNTPAATPMSQ